MPFLNLGNDSAPARRFWLPFLGGATIFALSCTVWLSMRLWERLLLTETTQQHAETLAGLVEEESNLHLIAIRRMGQRWVSNKGTSYEIWRRDAEQYVEDFSDLTAIQWVDQEGVARWIEPLKEHQDAVDLQIVFDERGAEGLRRAQAAGDLAISRVTSPQGRNGKEILVFYPLIVDGQDQGFLMGVIDPNVWIGKMFNNTASTFDLEVFDGQERLYVRTHGERSESASVAVGVATVHVAGVTWIIKARPNASSVAASYSVLSALALGLGVLASVTTGLLLFFWQTSRRREQVVQRTNERFEVAVQGAEDGLWDWSLKTDEFWYAPRFWNLLGYEDPAEFPSNTIESFRDRLHPDDQDMTWNAVRKHLEERELYDVECRFKAKDGQYRWLRVRGLAQRDEDGEPYRISGSVQDIHDRKMIEQTLRRTNNELALQKSAMDQHAIVAITDPSGVITYVNDKFCDISKYDREELIGQTHRIINSGRHPKSFFVQMWKTIVRGDTWRGEVCNRAKDGELYWVDTTIVPFRGEDGAIAQYVAIRADITERKEAERQLALQKSAIDQHAIVAITDPSGVITYVNEKFCDISKYDREELIGQTHRIINSGHHPKSFFIQMWKTIVRGVTWRGEVCNRAKDGGLYWVDTTIVPFRGEDGAIAQYVAIRADITERKEAERQLHDVNEALNRTNDELERFVYTASHDLKSPAVTLQGFLGHLKRDLAEGRTDRAPGFIDRLEAAVSKMRQNVDDLLELSRVGKVSHDPEWIDLDDAVRAAVENHGLTIQEKGVEMRIQDDLPRVYADPNRLADVIDNLITNALKYGTGNARPVISVGGDTVNGQARFYVRDNGQGIASEYHEKVFNLFERFDKSKEGTGVGLPIVKKIAEHHGGSVWIESELGEGSAFWVSFPHQDAPQGTEHSARPLEQQRGY